jgi:hypothetical protein
VISAACLTWRWSVGSRISARSNQVSKTIKNTAVVTATAKGHWKGPFI